MTELLPGGSALFILLFSFAVTLVGTPIAREMAHRYGIIDRPRERVYKKHDKPIAYLGGLFVYIAFGTGLLLVYSSIKSEMPPDEDILKGISLPWVFAALTFIFLSGLVDDLIGVHEKRVGMHPGVKMLLLAIGGTLLFIGGVKVDFIRTGSGIVDIILNYPLTIFWILGITNAANVIDNMNGISAGSGAVAGCFFFLIGFYNNDPVTTGLSLVLIGTMVGFLPYNYPRASIFLGDAGSITHGFFLAMLGLLAGRPEVVHGHALTGTLAPIFILMFFVFDTWFVALNRGRRHINFWWGGLDHTTHRFHNLGFSKAFVAILIWMLNAIFGVVAIIIFKTTWWFAIPFSLLVFFSGVRFWIYLGSIPIEEIDIRLIGAPSDNKNHLSST